MTVGAIEVLTAALVIITAAYCYFTYRILERNSEMVAQMRAQHESFIAPIINASIKIKHSSVLCLTVKNVGHSAAKNLRLSLDKDFHQFGSPDPQKNLRTYPMFNELIPSFSPGEEMFIMMVQGHELNDEKLNPKLFSVRARYEFGGKTIDQSHDINLEAFMKTGQDRDETLQEIEKIRKAVEKIAAH